MVRYERDSEGDAHLYIQDGDIDYLQEASKEDMTFVVINRYTGEVADVSSFTLP